MSDVALSLCASQQVSSCALRRDGALFGPVFTERGHKDLPAAVDQLFREAGTSPQDLGRVLLDLGPGSYTGLRVAVTHALFCRRFLGAEVWTVTSLELAAVAAWREGRVPTGAPLRPVLDARRNRFHHALVGAKGGEAKVGLLDPPRATSLQELAAAVRPGEHILCSAELWPRLAEEIAASRIEPARHDAALLFDPSLDLRVAAPGIEPLYLMGSYAEPTGPPKE